MAATACGVWAKSTITVGAFSGNGSTCIRPGTCARARPGSVVPAGIPARSSIATAMAASTMLCQPGSASSTVTSPDAVRSCARPPSGRTGS